MCPFILREYEKGRKKKEEKKEGRDKQRFEKKRDGRGAYD